MCESAAAATARRRRRMRQGEEARKEAHAHTRGRRQDACTHRGTKPLGGLWKEGGSFTWTPFQERIFLYLFGLRLVTTATFALAVTFAITFALASDLAVFCTLACHFVCCVCLATFVVVGSVVPTLQTSVA